MITGKGQPHTSRAPGGDVPGRVRSRPDEVEDRMRRAGDGRVVTKDQPHDPAHHTPQDRQALTRDEAR